MLLEKKVAKNMNEEKVTQLATEYAQKLVEKFGYDKKITIEPGQIIYNKSTAKKKFIPSLTLKDLFSPDLNGKLFKPYNPRLSQLINKGSPFVYDSTAYTPLRKLWAHEQREVEDILGYKTPKFSIFKKRQEFRRLYGFGGEIGHLIVEKIWSKDIMQLEECVDILSNMYEIELDIKNLLKKTKNQKNNFEKIKNKKLTARINDNKFSIDLNESLLFESKEDIMGKIKDYCSLILNDLGKGSKKIDDKLLEIFLKQRVEDYILTYHFEGQLIFNALYEKTDHNLEDMYKLFGELMLEGITSVETILKELDFSEENLEKYKGTFSKDIFGRYDCIAENLDLNSLGIYLS